MESLFVDSADGTRLRLCRIGSGEKDVLIVPGLAEHAGRYAHVAKGLTGFRSTILELRGHGQSAGKRGHVDAWSQYVDDLKAAIAASPTPPMIVAHSMGGLVTLDALREGVTVEKVALSNPLLGVRVKAPKLKVMAAGLLSKVLPRLSLTNEIPPEHLSRDLEVGKAYKADPLVYDTITPRWFTEMKAAQERVLAHPYPGKAGKMALFYSDTDPIVDTAAGAEFADRNHIPKTLYTGMLHEIFNEIGKEEVIRAVGEWLRA